MDILTVDAPGFTPRHYPHQLYIAYGAATVQDVGSEHNRPDHTSSATKSGAELLKKCDERSYLSMPNCQHPVRIVIHTTHGQNFKAR